jgi:hypothetical protein
VIKVAELPPPVPNRSPFLRLRWVCAAVRAALELGLGLSEPRPDRAVLYIDGLGSRPELAGAVSGGGLLAARPPPMSRVAAVCLNPYPNSTQLSGKPGVHSSHQLKAGNDCDPALIELIRPGAQLRHRQPGRGNQLRLVASPAVAGNLRQHATGEAVITSRHRYPRQGCFGCPTRFADFSEGTDRLDVRDGLRPATESEQDIGSRDPADRGVGKGETLCGGLIDSGFAGRQRLLVTTGAQERVGKIRRRPTNIVLSSMTASQIQSLLEIADRLLGITGQALYQAPSVQRQTACTQVIFGISQGECALGLR